MVDRALNWLIEQALRIGGSALNTLRAGVSQVLDFFGVRTRFTVESGEAHSIYYEERGGELTLIISSTPTEIRDFLSFYEQEYSIEPDSQKGVVLTEIRDFLSSDIEPLIQQIEQAKTHGDSATEQAKQSELLQNNIPLTEKLRRLMSNNRDIGRTVERYALEGLTGTYNSLPKATGDRLTPDHQPQASILVWAASRSFFSTSSNMKERAKSRASKGYAINIHENRHKEGRTFKNEGKTTKNAFIASVNSQLSSAATNQDKRNLVVDLMKHELSADVTAMRAVADRDDVWPDINALDINQSEKDDLIGGIRSRISRGLSQIASQDMERLNNGDD
jgi:hypothetical protein